MSFFEKPVQKVVSKISNSPPPNSLRGDRMLAYRVEVEKTIEPRKSGIQSSAKVDRVPRGCLFKIKGGFFDLDGYWCVRKSGHDIDVRRGAPRKITALLTDAQKKELRRVRNNALKNGLR